MPDSALQRFNQAAVIPGDFDGDGIVGNADLNLMSVNWFSDTAPPEWKAPFDGRIDNNELNELAANWFSSVESEMPMGEATAAQEMQAEAVEECLPEDPVQTSEDNDDPVLPIDNSLAVSSVDVPQTDVPVADNIQPTQDAQQDEFQDYDSIPATTGSDTTSGESTGLIDNLEPRLVLEI